MYSAGRRRILRLATISCAIASACVSLAEFGLAADDVDLAPVYSRQRRFAIPFHVDDSPLAEKPHQVQLHVSDDAGQSWRLHVALPPQERRFIFEAPQDGAYLFLVRSVDAVGRTQSTQAPRPELLVVVDSVAPIAELSAERTADGNVHVAWTASDAHLDGASRRLKFRAAGSAAWREQPAPVQSETDSAVEGAATILADASWAGVDLELEIVDAAGNRTVNTQHVELTRAPPAAAAWNQSNTPPVVGLPPVAPASEGLVAGRPPQAPPLLRRFDPPSADARWFRSGEDRIEPTNTQTWTPRVAKRAETRSPRPIAPPGGAANYVEAIPTPLPAVAENDGAPFHAVADTTEADWGRRQNESRGSPAALRENATRPSSSESQDSLIDPDDLFLDAGEDELGATGEDATVDLSPAWDAPIAKDAEADLESAADGAVDDDPAPWPPQWSDERPSDAFEPPADLGDQDDHEPVFVRAPKVAVEYQTESPQGELTEVEVWGTSDGGASWRLYGVDDDLQTPAEIELKAPGRHGLRVVAADARGWNSGRPTAEDRPDVWIDYDPNPPHVRLLRAEIDADGEIAVFWEAADRKLAPNPVTIRFADDRRGPWRVVAERVANSGEFRWRLPENAPPRLYFRVEVRDAAGNLGEDAAGRPIELDHLRPKASIRGVRAADARSQRMVQLF